MSELATDVSRPVHEIPAGTPIIECPVCGSRVCFVLFTQGKISYPVVVNYPDEHPLENTVGELHFCSLDCGGK